jgi:hypothetical protein
MDYSKSHQKFLNGDRISVSGHGEYHHDTYPALLKANGDIGFFNHGIPHRDGNLVASIRMGVTIDSGKYLGCKSDVYEWWQNGRLHRGNGPAVITIMENGKRHREYHLNGVQVNKKTFEYISNLTNDDIVLYKLEHGRNMTFNDAIKNFEHVKSGWEKYTEQD